MGGGVAIAYDTRKARFKKYTIPNNKYELVCATGTVSGNTRKLAVIALYLRPKQTAAVTKEVEGCIADCILRLKTELDDPLIILGGGHEP